MGFLRALSRAAGVPSRWRSTSCLKQGFLPPCASLGSFRHHSNKAEVGIAGNGNAELPLGTRVRMLFNAGSSLRAGAFFGGSFKVGNSRGFAREADAESDAEEGEEGDDEAVSDDDAATAKDKDNCHWKLWRKFQNNPHRSVVALIKEWQDEGNEFTKLGLQKLIIKLRARRRFIQALRVMDWVMEERPFEMTAYEYQMHLTAASQANKMGTARKIYDGLSPEMRTTSVSSAMLTAYASKNFATEAEELRSTFTPTTPQTFNCLILMYIRMGLDAKAAEVYESLKASGIQPSDLTYFMVAKYKDRMGVELDETEAQATLDAAVAGSKAKRFRFQTVKNALIAYAYLGKLDGVERAWKSIEKESWLPTFCCAAAIEAYGVLGEVEKAEGIAEQVEESKRSQKQFYPALVQMYARNGMMDKAEKVVEQMKERGLRIGYGSYDELIAGYLEHKQPKKALQKLKEALEVVKENRSPRYTTVLSMLPVYAESKDVEGAEALFKKYKGWRDVKIFNELLKVYVEAKKPADKFHGRMSSVKVAPNDETKKLLKQLEALSVEEQAQP